MRKSLFIIALLALAPVSSIAQTTLEEIAATPEKAGGIYYAYPYYDAENTPAPKGYKPFYISHYGRHGSRYLISENDYTDLRDRLMHADANNALTPLGKDVLGRLDLAYKEAKGRAGELTPLGNRQHHDIATRMYQAYPEVFVDDAEISATSTTVMRCAHSMFAFTEGLKEQNPALKIPRESSNATMYYMNAHVPECGQMASKEGPWYQTWRRFNEANLSGDRLAASLFSDKEYVDTWIDPMKLLDQVYRLAIDMQNAETPVKFTDLLTDEELYNLWKSSNFSFFARNSSYAPAENAHLDCSKTLIQNIIDSADAYVDGGKTGATLRFGHDGNITPLTGQLRLKGCYTGETEPEGVCATWSDYRISPMGANLQIVFFRNKQGDVLAKVLLNEREIAVDGVPTDSYPYYKWSDLRAHLVKAAQ